MGKSEREEGGVGEGGCERVRARVRARPGEETTFVHGYFYRTAGELLDSLSQRHGPGSACFQPMAKFVA